MFERFTEAARQVVTEAAGQVLAEAQVAATELRHNFIGTEHLLLGFHLGTGARLMHLTFAPRAELQLGLPPLAVGTGRARGLEPAHWLHPPGPGARVQMPV